MSSGDFEEAVLAGGGSENGVVRDLAAQALGVVVEEGNAHVVVVPAGADAKVINLEEHGLSPWRPRGTAYPKSVDAFVAYVRRHLTDATTIWVEPLDGKIIAVLNDHEKEQGAEWGDLRAKLDLPVTPEWEHWMKRNAVYGDQRSFAEHIEEGLDEIRTPDGATVLEIAQTMQATVTAEFRSASRLDNGAIAVQWVEDVNARGGKAGDLEIPQELILGLSPFYGEAPYEVKARVRYRIQGSDLRIGYALIRPDEIVRDCLTAIRDRLLAEFPNQVFIGAAPRGHGTRPSSDY